MQRRTPARPSRSSPSPRRASPRTPGARDCACPCSRRNESGRPSSALFLSLALLLTTQFRLIFRMFASRFLAGEVLQPTIERCRRQTVLAAIVRQTRPALTPSLDVNQPPGLARLVLEFTGAPPPYEGARHAAQLHYSIWVQRLDAYVSTTAGKIKARPSRRRKWLVGLRVFGIRRKPPAGGSAAFLKTFNGPTAIHRPSRKAASMETTTSGRLSEARLCPASSRSVPTFGPRGSSNGGHSRAGSARGAPETFVGAIDTG